MSVEDNLAQRRGAGGPRPHPHPSLWHCMMQCKIHLCMDQGGEGGWAGGRAEYSKPNVLHPPKKGKKYKTAVFPLINDIYGPTAARIFKCNLLALGNIHSIRPAPPPTPTPHPSHPCPSLSLTTLQTKNRLRKIKAGNAAGSDAIRPRPFKSCEDQLSWRARHVSNYSEPLRPWVAKLSTTGFTNL